MPIIIDAKKRIINEQNKVNFERILRDGIKDVEEFNLSEERRKLFEKELLGKITSAGRIYRKIIEQDKEFIEEQEKLIEDLRDKEIDWVIFWYKWDKLIGEKK